MKTVLSRLLPLVVLSIISDIATAQPCLSPDQPGNLAAGWTTASLQRAGRTLNCRLYYPAVSTGQNSGVAAVSGPYPMIAFGHGFAMQSSYYNSYYEHLASNGYIVIAPQFPDTQHGELAQDLLACIDWLRMRNSDAQSALFGAVDTSRAGVAGHSMGGGACLLAAAYDSRIRAAAPMCPAETTPSVIARMSQIAGAVCIIAASNDGITPVSTQQQPMYNAAQAFKSLAVLQGGNHTRCMDTPLFDFTDPGGSMTRPVQQQLTRRYMTALFNLFLKDDSCGWSYSYGVNAPHPSVILSRSVRPMQPKSFLLRSPLSGSVPAPAPLLWQKSTSLNPADTVRYTVQTASNASFSPLRYEMTSFDTSASLPAAGLDTVTYWRVVARTASNQQRFSDNVGRIYSTVPVELAAFSSLRIGSVVRLRWTTETETSNFGFDIQRSDDDRDYATIGFVAGSGSTTERRDYAFDDNRVTAAWYRLRQTDFDGTSQLHPALYVPAIPTTAMSAELYPTTVTAGENLMLHLQLPESSGVTISFWSIGGSLVGIVPLPQLKHSVRHTLAVQVPPLSVGLYFVRIESDNGGWTGRLSIR
jgi:predicted dienelactone hydrolase